MFEQTFVNTRVQPRKPAAVAASVVLQSAAVGGLLLIPLLHVELLPLPKSDDPKIWMILSKPAPPPPPPETAVRRKPRQLAASLLIGPTRVPDKIMRLVDEPDSPDFGMPALSAIAGGVLSLVIPDVPPPAPPAVKAPEVVKPPQKITVASSLQAAKLIFGPKPEYPSLARTARVQGTVHLQAVIGVDGGVRNLAVLSGPPLLVKSALEAVSRWRYQPTLLAGAPVEVTTLIDVNFTLSQ